MCPGAWKKRYAYAVSTWGGYIVSNTQIETREGGQTNAVALKEMTRMRSRLLPRDVYI